MELTLTPFFHPTMQMPFLIDGKSMPCTLGEDSTIVDLMDLMEDKFLIKAKEAGAEVELQITVLWNYKDFKKALNPSDKISKHFVDGETFGIYGDILPPEKPAMKEEEKLPIIILTGFLGSGKTTLLNYMLREQQEKKIAIIENEFGEISIDDELLKQDKMNMAEEVMTMANGCICCTIRGDLVAGLRKLINKIKSGASQIDLIAIETTGMADPVPIVRTFMEEELLTEEMRLDGVVTLADAKHLIQRLDDDIEEGKVNIAFQQIAFADKIILNKLDLVSAETAIAVKDRIRDINKFAKVLPAVKSRVKLSELTDMRSHDIVHFVDVDDLAQEQDVGHGELFAHTHGHDVDMGHEQGHGGHGDGGHGGHGDGGHGGHGGHESGHDSGHGDGHGGGHSIGHVAGHDNNAIRHDARVNSFAIVKEGVIIPKKLNRWVQMIGKLPKERGTVFRIKAIFAVKGHPYRHVFHAVMDHGEEEDAGLWEEGEKKINKIVFIGRSLDHTFLRNGFEELFDTSAL
jgi:G3E family GTPase